MGDVREWIAEAIAAEIDEHDYEDDDEKRAQVAYHFADVLLALPGVAIVELPEADETGNYWYAYRSNYVFAADDGLVITRHGTTFGTSTEVRTIAAALLAAANAAEEPA
jgi:hypothetical protein